MQKKPFSQEKQQQIETLVAGWGKIVAARFLQGQEKNAEFDLQDIEQLVDVATAALAQGVFDSLIQSKTLALGQQQPRPDCKRPCSVRIKDRPLYVKSGKINFHEPLCYCPSCRRDFFPPADPSAS